jgi:hypothetical protein
LPLSHPSFVQHKDELEHLALEIVTKLKNEEAELGAELVGDAQDEFKAVPEIDAAAHHLNYSLEESTTGGRRQFIADAHATSLSQKQALERLPLIFAQAAFVVTTQVFLRKFADTVKIPMVGKCDLAKLAAPSFYSGADQPAVDFMPRIAQLEKEWAKHKPSTSKVERMIGLLVMVSTLYNSSDVERGLQL